MLPHGYEGQGPEHSSARIERFLQLAADNNMQVAQPTSAAQIFHLLRRQMIRLFRKPLVIMTPKSLLRAKDASSLLVELARGEFHTVIPDQGELDPKDVKRIILCSGKGYFDLAAARPGLLELHAATPLMPMILIPMRGCSAPPTTPRSP